MNQGNKPQQNFQKPIQTNRDTIYIEEILKFVNQEVRVKDSFGEEFTGIVKAINLTHLNIVLMTPTEKILIKNPMLVRRTRKYQG